MKTVFSIAAALALGTVLSAGSAQANCGPNHNCMRWHHAHHVFGGSAADHSADSLNQQELSKLGNGN
jgi:hypothetical protein